jgi:hypothetical protein
LPALAAQAGYFADNAPRAVPPKLPRLRWAQKSILRAMLRWLSDEGAATPPPDIGP